MPRFSATARSTNRTVFVDLLAAVSTALLLWLAIAPIGQFYLAWVALVPLLWRLHYVATTRRAALLGLGSGFCFFLLGFHWLFGATRPGYFVVCVVMSLYWMLATTLTHRVIARSRRRNSCDATHRAPSTSSETATPFASMSDLLAVSAIWTATEYLRGVVLGGFPWLQIGHTQSPLVWMCQIADVAGVAGVTAWVVMINSVIACTIHWRRGALPACFGAALLTVLICGYGWLRMEQSGVSSPPEIRIALVQSNFIHARGGAKTVTQQQQIDYLLEKSKSIKNVDVIAWPETILPGLNVEARTEPKLGAAPFLNRTLDQLTALARERNASIISGGYFVGGFNGEPGKRKATDIRNSVYHISRDGSLTNRYDKIRLVPFAEWLPFQHGGSKLHAFMKKFATAAYAGGYHLTPADELSVFDVNGTRVVTPICFEDTIAPLVRTLFNSDAAKRADVILNISNDGWFNRFEKAQHLQIAVFRSIENRVPSARVSNTGQSAFFDSCGRITASLPPFEEGVLTGECLLDPRITFYTRFGDVFAWVCIAASVIALGLPMRAGKRLEF